MTTRQAKVGCSMLGFVSGRLAVQRCLVVTACLLGAWGCSEGSGDGTGDARVPDTLDTTVASVVVSPGSVLLVGSGEARTLTARAYNAAGQEIPSGALSWTSSSSGQVHVDSSGMATARGALGSASITAEANGVVSAPVLVLLAKPAPGAVLVDDAQVVGAPKPVDPDAPFGVGWEYRLELRGISLPAVGDLLVGTGEAPVAGRVAAVDTSGANPVVTLKVVRAEELFAELRIDEELDLSAAHAELPAELAERYDLVANAEGGYELTPTPGRSQAELGRVGTRTQPLGAVGVRRLGPFSCEAQTTGAFPFSLAGGATGLTVTPDLDLIVDYDSANGGLRKLAVAGKVTVTFSVSDTLTLGFSGKVTCEGELLNISLPVFGPASLLFGGLVPLGAGFELAGELNLAQLGFELKATGEAAFEGGMVCPDGQDCSAITTLDTKGDLQPRWITPDAASLTAQLQLKPTLSGYAFMEFAVGPRFWRAAQLSFIRAKSGLAQEADLKLVAAQVADDAYRSDYKLSLASSVGTAPDLGALCKFFNISLAPVTLTFTAPLSTSPSLDSVSAAVAAFAEGELVEFAVSLDPSTLTYLTVYNVSEVQVYRLVDEAPDGDAGVVLVASQAATEGQREFALQWTADYTGTVGDNFFAFVVTRFLPFPGFDSLELGPALGPQASPINLLVGLPPSSPHTNRPFSAASVGVNDSVPTVSEVDPTTPYPSFEYDGCASGGVPLQAMSRFRASATSPGGAASSELIVRHSASKVKVEFSSRAVAGQAYVSTTDIYQGKANSAAGIDVYEGVLDIVNSADEPVQLLISWDATGTISGCNLAEASYGCRGFCGGGVQIVEYLPCMTGDARIRPNRDTTLFTLAAYCPEGDAGGVVARGASGSRRIEISPGRHQFAVGYGEGIANCSASCILCGYGDDCGSEQVGLPGTTSSMSGEIVFSLLAP